MKKLSIANRSLFVIGYMILAFGWWSFHLWRQNNRVFSQEQQIIALQYPNPETRPPEVYEKAEKNWQSGKRMVIAEGIIFTACLIWGLWVIRRSASREVSLARQRRNFMLSITHELKSPIASIQLVLETLLKRELTKEQRNPLLSNGLKDTGRLYSLVESLLLAARLEDNWRPAREYLDFSKITQEAIDSLRIRFPEAEFRLDIPADLPPVFADSLGLLAVVQNLLENALKYAPDSSPVTLSARFLGQRFRFQVADLGQGIPDAEKQSVFEKFYRMGNEETRQSTGTGLGLYIVRQVLKAHGGTVQVADNEPKGTIFTLEF